MNDAKNGPLVLIGGGEHAIVVAEIARLNEFEIRGYVAPEPSATEELVYLGDDTALIDHGDAWWILAVGATRLPYHRRSIVDRVEAGGRFATLAHPSALISRASTIEEGVVVGAAAVIQTGAHLGRHSIVGTGSIVEHDVDVGDHVVLGPRVTIGGGTRIGTGSFIGMGASIRDHLELGDEVTVGMGSIVIRPQATGTTHLGVDVSR